MSINELLMSLELGLIYAIVALGIYITFRILDFPDLTCDGSFVLGAATSSMLIKTGLNPWMSLMAAFTAGAFAGIITALLYLQLRVTNLLSGILVGFMLYSINLRVMGDTPNISLLNDITIFESAPLLPLAIICFLSCVFLTYLLLTDFGLSLQSIGQNTRLAQNSGVNVPVMTTLGLALSNAFIGLGGGLFAQHQGFADIGSGSGTLIIGLASVMIGEKLLSYRSLPMKILSCLAGSIVYRLFISFALHSDLIGLSTSDLNLVTGVLIVSIMYFSRRATC